MKFFEKDNQKIIWGDVIEVLSNQIPNDSVDLVFADPPYNLGKIFGNAKDHWTSNKEYLEWCYLWIELCLNKLKNTGSLYLMSSTQNMPYFDIFLREKAHILSRIIWHYDSSGVQAKKHFGSMYEPILFCAKNKTKYTFNAGEIYVEAKTGAKRKLIDYRKPTPAPYNSQKVPGNVWEIPRVRYRMAEYENHPTQKPIALIERIIKASSNVGDIILDPFSGTFTTSFVAKKLERKSIGIEIQEEYIKIGLRRLKILTHYKDEELKPETKSFTGRANGKAKTAFIS